MFIAHKVHKDLDESERGWYELGEISSIEMEEVEASGIDECWYWYAIGSYEGLGQILMRSGDKYDLHDCGHCSCYGPTDDIEFHGQTAIELVESIDPELMEEVDVLLAAAGIKPEA